MAPTIQLYDGTTTINLNSSGILTTRHQFTGASIDQERVEAGRDKWNLGTPSWTNATESLDLLITKSTPALIQAEVQKIETMLDKARQSALTWSGARVYIQVKHDGDSMTWRSEILAGRLEFGDVLSDMALGRAEARLIYTRRHYWEGSRTALQLSTEADTTPTTNEVTLHLTDDATAGQRNYIHIAAAQVTGVLPAPVELQIRNAEATAKDWRGFHLGNFVHMDPATVDPILTGGTGTSWTIDAEQEVRRWALSDGQLDDFAGQFCRVLALITNTPAGYLRAVMMATVGGLRLPVYKAPSQVYVDGSGIWDLGVVPIPPGGYTQKATGLSLALFGQKSGGGTLTVDHVHIMPAGHGLYRYVAQPGFTTPNTVAFVDDGPEGRVYGRTVSTGDEYPILRPYGEPLHLWPGKINRLRVMIAGSTKGDAVEAQAWYRPRRLTI